MKRTARRLVRLSPAAGRSVGAAAIGVVAGLLVVVQAGLLADLVARAFLAPREPSPGGRRRDPSAALLPAANQSRRAAP